MEAPRLIGNLGRFEQVISAQAALRGLSEAVVVEGTSGRVLARSQFTFTLTFEPVPEEALDRARNGEVVLLDDDDDRVRGLVRLDNFFDSYLFVGRLVDPRVLDHVKAAGRAVQEYTELKGRLSSLQITVNLIFLVVALLMLLAAVWFGLNFANYLATPISALIAAAERVRAGDMSVRVAGNTSDDELGNLCRAFDRMTYQIDSQRKELIEANRQLDERRQFTEAVLAGVSAGVLGLDRDAVIHLPNQSALTLLGVEGPDALVGRSFLAVLPEMAELLDASRKRPGKVCEAQVVLRRRGGVRRTVLVRITAGATDHEVRDFVVTFDDVTELLQAQRTAAWADVARRIAHEIKNPLTPIQLSAERLRRKYLKEITGDREVFQMCVDTIVRQVGDIGRMVDEFSAFARMPSPVMKPVNLQDLCRQAMFLQTSAHTGVHFTCRLPEDRVAIPCDQRQIFQALTNLLQNALDAIEGRETPADGTPLPPGDVVVSLEMNRETAVIQIEDNGKGLPTTVERHRLTEPYVTTRAKGTGLGLAIVKKIMEDHGGELLLEDREGGGARISLVIPRNRDMMGETSPTADSPQPAPLPENQREKNPPHDA
jgi:two-component system nitrogen regulation sensor histidine kinase NtrY